MMFVAAGEREITPGGGDCAQIEMLPRMLTKTRIVPLLIINLKFVERIDALHDSPVNSAPQTNAPKRSFLHGVLPRFPGCQEMRYITRNRTPSLSATPLREIFFAENHFLGKDMRLFLLASFLAGEQE